MKKTEFDYEVRQRKQLARMAYSKKNGSKSKKCSLPSDGLTRKQWEKRNGKVKVFNMNSATNWEGFKAMSLDTQKEYIARLVEQYGLTYAALSEMFGCTPLTVRKYFEKNNFEVAFKRGKSMNEEQKEAWADFLSGHLNRIAEPEHCLEEPAPTEETPCVCTGEDCNNTDDVVAACEEKASKSVNAMLREFSLIFEGKIDPISIGNSILAIIGSDANGRIEVRCAM